jgi:hypothetical protein
VVQIRQPEFLDLAILEFPEHVQMQWIRGILYDRQKRWRLGRTGVIFEKKKKKKIGEDT